MLKPANRFGTSRTLNFRSPPPLPSTLSEPLPSSSQEETILSAAAERPGRAARVGKAAGLALLAGVGLASSVAGAASFAAQHLPLCEAETSMVAWSEGQVCVSAELSTTAEAGLRGARGFLHRDGARHDLAASASRVLQPAQPIHREPDGELTVNTWNLHHGTGQDSDGARPQLDLQIQTIVKTDADVDLLQEITPWHAQRLVDGTGKVGYYSQSTPRQGNLILVSPELEVSENHRVTLNHEITSQDQAAQVMDNIKGTEPRQAQLLRLRGEDTGGQDLAVFNTHLSTGTATPADRAAESEMLVKFLERHVAPDQFMVGGGDLNNRKDQGIVADLAQEYHLEGASIDWLASGGVTPLEIRASDHHALDGTRLSDHPMVVGRYRVGS